jgi:hypothetical protein
MTNKSLNAQMAKISDGQRVIWAFGFWEFFRHSDLVISHFTAGLEL